MHAHARAVALLHAVDALVEHLNALHLARQVQARELHLVVHVETAREHRARHHAALARQREEVVVDEVERRYC